MLKLTEIFCVKEMQEFKIDDGVLKYRICENILQYYSDYNNNWNNLDTIFNMIDKVNTLPFFTNEELIILQSIDEKYGYIEKKDNGSIIVVKYTNDNYDIISVECFKNIFKGLSVEHGPVRISDYTGSIIVDIFK